MYIGSVGALISCTTFIYAPIESPWILELFLLTFGLFSAGFLPAFAVAKELCNKRYVATGLSFMNMMNMVGIAIGQPIIGYLLDKLWKGEIINNIRVYPLEAYYISLSLLPIGMLISLLILPLLKETYCRSSED